MVEKSGADEVGARECFQTLGAALVQVKQSDRSVLLKRAPYSPQYYRSKKVITPGGG